MKRYEDEDIKRIGMRIKSARALTGFNQTEFCEKYGLSVGAYKTWESGKFAPRMVNLQELCRCFVSEGIFNVTASWFLKGEGPAPTHIRVGGGNEIDSLTNLSQEDVIEEIDLFKENQIRRKEQPIVAMISDDLMSPYFSISDIVGGVRINNMPPLGEMNNKPFLIEIKPNQFLVRWCFSDGNGLFFKPQNSALIFRIDDQKIGKILWHRRSE